MSWREILKTDITLPFLRRGPKGRGFYGALRHPLAWFEQLWEADMRAVFTQLEAIVKTNSPLPEGLAVCAPDAPNGRVRHLLVALSERMESGMSLSEAMTKSSQGIPRHWIDVVHAAERTGRLPEALRMIVERSNRGLETGRRIRNRIAYFVLLLSAETALMSFIVLKIIPVFSEIYEEFGKGVPLALTVLADVESVLQRLAESRQWLLIVIPVALAVPLAYRRIGWFQSLVSRGLLGLPVLGELHRKTNLERIASVLELLIAGGVPLPDALRSAAEIDVTRPFQKALRDTAQSVEAGHPLSQALEARRYFFGELLATLVMLGEHSGRIDGSLGYARDLYRRAITRTHSTLADALVPVGVLICASVVLLACLSIFASTATIGDAILSNIY